MKFFDYWKQVNGTVEQTLVFDCKFTKYQLLDWMENESINFITLRKRNKKLIITLNRRTHTTKTIDISKYKQNIYFVKIKVSKRMMES